MSLNVAGVNTNVSVVDAVAENVTTVVETAVDNVAENVTSVVETAVDAVTENVTAVVENATNVADSVSNVVKEKKPVAFLIDVESKAIVESLGDLEDFSVSNLMSVLPQLMKHVENYKNLKGPQKRELVIKMVKHIIDITDGPGNDEVWDPILKQLVPGLIDTLLEVNDGKLKLRKRKLSFLKIFCCGPPKVSK